MVTIVSTVGPSGVGKGVTCQIALSLVPEYRGARSLTTRPCRNDDVMYDYASSEDEFMAAFNRGELIEFDRHHFHLYGKRVPADDGPWLYELDVNGAITLKRKYPQTRQVLLVPPAPMRQVLEERMVSRAEKTGVPISAEQLQARVDRADYEITTAREHGVDLEIVTHTGQQQQIGEQMADFMRKQLPAT